MPVLETVLTGIVSSLIASLIIIGINLLIRMSVNKSKIKTKIMLTLSVIGFDENNAVQKPQFIKDVFTYEQLITLKEYAHCVFGKNKAKRIIEIFEKILILLNQGQAGVLIVDEICNLNTVFNSY